MTTEVSLFLAINEKKKLVSEVLAGDDSRDYIPSRPKRQQS